MTNGTNLETSLYADDAALLLADTKLKNLRKKINTELSALNEWFISNKLTLNLTKTNYMLIANKHKLTEKQRKKFKVSIGKYTLHEVEKIKYLGVILDNKLSWNHHIDYLTTKLSQVAGILYKVRNHISMKSRLTIYNGLAGSYLNYGITAWGSATNTVLNRLHAAQNRLVRYMTYLPPHSSTSDKYKKHNILTINQIYTHEVGKFVHSIHNKFAPEIFHSYFTVVSNYRTTRRRQHNIYTLPQPCTERGKSSVVYNGVQIWSTVPYWFQSLSKKSFSYHFKQNILSNN